MDLWQLQVFCKVVEHKSFSEAGRTVHLSQPTVSSHIKDLEDHFSCRLIDRLAKEAVPTRAGDLLYGYAVRLLALRNETETAMAEFMGKIRGRLSLGGSTIPGAYILPKIMGEYLDSHPEVNISLHVGDTEKIVGDTLSGLLELSLVGAKIAGKRVIQEQVMEDRMRLVAPALHKWASRDFIELKEFLKEPFILREEGSGTRKSIRDSLQKVGFAIEDLNVAAVMGSTEAVRQGVRSGIGVSILSDVAVAEDLKYGTIVAVEIPELDLRRDFFLTRDKSRSPSPLCRSFIRFLKQKQSS